MDQTDHTNQSNYVEFSGRMSKYDPYTNKWTSQYVTGSFDPNYFAFGSLRAVYKCFVSGQFGKETTKMVAKIALPETQTPIKTYYTDVKVQAIAACCAQAFSDNPHIYRTVKMLNAALLTVPHGITVQTPFGSTTSKIFHLEEMLDGAFVKYTNNYDFIDQTDRNTPQAFSHYSYAWSQGTLLICDLQGCSKTDSPIDIYTDPQVHTNTVSAKSDDDPSINLNWNGTKSTITDLPSLLTGCMGDLGMVGINAFFSTHHCNSICRALLLEPSNPKIDDDGTLVLTTTIDTAAPIINGQNIPTQRESPVQLTSENTIQNTIPSHVLLAIGYQGKNVDILSKLSQIMVRPRPIGFYEAFICWFETLHTDKYDDSCSNATCDESQNLDEELDMFDRLLTT